MKRTTPTTEEDELIGYVLIIKPNQPHKVMLAIEAFQKWKELEQEFRKYSYVVPTSSLYPEIYKVDRFLVNEHRMQSPLHFFEAYPITTRVDALRVIVGTDIYALDPKEILPFYERFLNAKRAKLAVLRTEAEVLNNLIQAHDERYDALFRK